MLNIDLEKLKKLKNKKAIYVVAEKISEDLPLSEKETIILHERWNELSEETLEKIFTKIDFAKIFSNEKKKFSNKDINKYLEVAVHHVNDRTTQKVLKNYILPVYKLDIYYIRRLIVPKRNPSIETCIYTYQLSEKDIESLKNDSEFPLNWDLISACMKLSESFMRKYSEYLYWKMISIHQEFSNEFLEEFYEYLDLDIIEERIMNKDIESIE